MHLGRPRTIAAWLDDGDVLVDCGPASTMDALIAGLEGTRPTALLLTHIHLDHAGAAGALVARWPDLPVYVHERGARHLADPERLLSSARRVYGDVLDRLWGEMLPVPADNLHPLSGGETVLGAYQVADTPGHASHHVCFRRDDTAFVGDVAGIRMVPGALALPPTPPPDIDVEAWGRSLDLVAGWAPRRLAIAHFGEIGEVSAQLTELRGRLEEWADIARAGDRERFVAIVGERLAREDDPSQVEAYGNPVTLTEYAVGLERYWATRDAG